MIGQFQLWKGTANDRPRRPRGRTRRALALGLAGRLLLLAGTVPTRADLQFDVYVGYGADGGAEGIVRESGWFPVTCEVFNDGPGFEAVFELSSRQLGGGQTRRLAIELPTNTRKRFSFPMFAGARYSSWEARLLDVRGKVRAERTDLRTRELNWETFLLGGLSQSLGGLPAFPKAGHNRQDQHPTVARLSLEHFPDNPIALEGLTALYLNSARAPEFRAPQAEALTAWVLGGGHLIVAPDQITDLTGTPWLAALLPVEFSEVTVLRPGPALQAWLGAAVPTGPGSPAGPAPRPGAQPAPGPLAGGVADPVFAQAEMPVFSGRVRDGQTHLAAEETPLIVSATRGRGQVTVLAFNPEREPFRSWQHRPWFWARLCDISGEWFDATPRNLYGGWSLDAVFGAMIETRQVRKLPVEWLLLLLVVYLGVIGPFDRWFLKKINRQMLTWITFPAYVVLFSLLIYYIGYRLRAGETEWNELHVVDVQPHGADARLRGRTYASLYSSSNARYRLASELPSATLRSEFLGPSGGGRESAGMEAVLKPAGFEAGVAVPVWSSLLYASDWAESGPPPFTARLEREGPGRVRLELHNRLPRPLKGLYLVVDERLHDLGEVAAGARRVWTLNTGQAPYLRDLLAVAHPRFWQAAQRRQRAFGGGQQEWLDLTPENLLAASFVGRFYSPPGPSPGGRTFLYPVGMDLTGVVERGHAALFAWDPGESPPGTSLARFTPPRSSRNTWYRLTLPLGSTG